jgi:hypothetical protein
VSHHRRDGAHLASVAPDREAPGGPVRNEGVVRMFGENVFARMRRVAGNVTPCWKRHENRYRQDIGFGHHDRRFEYREIRRRRRQKIVWHWRRGDEAEVRKHDDRPLDVGEFLRRRRRHVIIDKGKRRRRLERDGKQGQAPPRVPSMRSMRVPAQIRPVRLRRIDQAGALPRERFPAHRDDRAHPLCQRIASVQREKFLVAI